MAKDNAQIQRDKRAKEKALLERIGAEKRSLIVSKTLDDALQVLSKRHDFEEWQETVSTFLINLAAVPAELDLNAQIADMLAGRNVDLHAGIARDGGGGMIALT